MALKVIFQKAADDKIIGMRSSPVHAWAALPALDHAIIHSKIFLPSSFPPSRWTLSLQLLPSRSLLVLGTNKNLPSLMGGFVI